MGDIWRLILSKTNKHDAAFLGKQSENSAGAIPDPLTEGILLPFVDWVDHLGQQLWPYQIVFFPCFSFFFLNQNHDPVSCKCAFIILGLGYHNTFYLKLHL